MHFDQNDILSRDALIRELMRPLAVFMLEDGVTELVINQPCVVHVEIGPEWRRFDVPELTYERLMSLAQAIATFTEQEISAFHPILSAMLPGGERVQIVVPPAVEQGMISFSIRLPSPEIKSLEMYERDGAFHRYLWARSPLVDYEEYYRSIDDVDRRLMDYLEQNQLSQFLRLAVQQKKNIAVVGNTGSGKTTLMKTICQCIPPEERLITIEDVRELFLPKHENRVHLLYSKGGQGAAQVTPSDLIASNMRMKPDRVLLAELRGAEAFDFLKLLTTGHSGSITSYHAESCALATERYVFMCKEHEHAAIYDADSLKRLVALTLDIIVHVVARVVHDEQGNAIRKERYVAEVQFDPVQKLKVRFGDSIIHQVKTS